MDLTIVLYLQIYKSGMITMLSNSLNEQLDVNRRTCHIAMKVVSAGSFCSVVWWSARAACAGVLTGSVEALKARLGFKSLFRSHMASGTYGRVLCCHNVIAYPATPNLLTDLRIFCLDCKISYLALLIP
jgi:hypothetical protein